MGLGGILIEPYLLQLHVLDLFLELAVLRPHPAQVKVVAPEIAGAVLQPDQAALQRSNCAHRPDADQAGVVLGVTSALDLDREPQHLQEQHTHQDDKVAITSEHRFHEGNFKFLVSSF